MQWSGRRSLIACTGLALMVSVAYAVGRARAEIFIGLGSFAAVVLSVAAAFRPWPTERVAGTIVLGWVVLATLTEQFAWAAGTHGVLVAGAWLILPVVGGVVLPARGYWWSGLGCWAAAFAGIAATTYSVHSIYSGAGLVFVWRS
ncbi:hypothetical protein [Limnoglobus roseus]|uniref:Uncharacterized protein n=1 Tax=Limnoglobus roseus TaxID=2598579 RepID=A0A5C1AGE7_9BACT|nr:hypothetical protein [Limnoglobus roseus]QEL16184.1 hypothetical protein PX52LOC_03124 [Limnoglobus roseus]